MYFSEENKERTPTKKEVGQLCFFLGFVRERRWRGQVRSLGDVPAAARKRRNGGEEGAILPKESKFFTHAKGGC